MPTADPRIAVIRAWLDRIGETDQAERNRVGRLAMGNPAVMGMIDAETTRATAKWWEQ